MSKVLPHHPQDTESGEARLMLRGKEIARLCVDGNDPVDPRKLIEWMGVSEGKASQTADWTNLRIRVSIRAFEEYQSLEHSYVVLVGDRLETDDEYNARQDEIINRWQREYEEYISKKYFFEENCVGKARVEEIIKKKKRPINKPRRSELD